MLRIRSYQLLSYGAQCAGVNWGNEMMSGAKVLATGRSDYVGVTIGRVNKKKRWAVEWLREGASVAVFVL